MRQIQYGINSSFISYMGGKSLLANKIIPLIPPHTCYCEVFAGAAWLFFKKKPSEVEIINDINSELVNLFRVVKFHLDEFIRCLKYIPIARDEYKRFKQENPNTLTDIQRAVRFYYLLKTSYCSFVPEGRSNMSISTKRQRTFNSLRAEESLLQAHLRLSGVYIENLHYKDCIVRFDKPHTFFYLDPPYYGRELYYGKGIFSRDDFEVLRDLLLNLKGKFILSINDTPETRRIFKDFLLRQVNTVYNTGPKRRQSTEFLVLNYEPFDLQAEKLVL